MTFKPKTSITFKLVMVTASALTLMACNNNAAPSDPVETNVAQSDMIEKPVSSTAPLALKNRMADYEALFAAGDIGATFDYVPPKLRYSMMAATGESEAAMRKFVAQEWKTALKTVSLETFSFNMDDTRMKTSLNDRPYILIPTTMIAGVNAEPGKVVKTDSHTVALMDDGQWYIARLDDPIMFNLFKSAYPDLVDINLPDSTMKKMDKSELDNAQ
jgi:hypothetical protein